MTSLLIKHASASALNLRDYRLCVKAESVRDDGTFEGYGSVFGEVDSYSEIVAAGAFAESLAELGAKDRRIPVLWQHRSEDPLGVYDEIREDGRGLYVKGRLLIESVAQAKEAHALLKAGAVTGLSIGYWIVKAATDEKTGVRTLLQLDLVEVSLVTFPALDSARVDSVKVGPLGGPRAIEDMFKRAGFSSRKAKAAASAAWQAIGSTADGGLSPKLSQLLTASTRRIRSIGKEPKS